MPAFFNVLAPNDALKLLLDRLPPLPDTELVPTQDALDRVCAEDIESPEDLPSFPRSTMDGFSVRSHDTFGASEGLPAYLDVVGEVPMGRTAEIELSSGQAAKTYTGGMLAKGADAVVMVENTQPVDGGSIEVLRPVAPGENVLQVGEDTRSGDVAVEAGRVLRPQELGGLLALGITHVNVVRRPRVAIVSTGDELVPPDRKAGAGQARDINTYSISALVTQAGGVPTAVGLVEDDIEAQRSAAFTALEAGDVLVFSAGSSMSSRDMTAEVFNSLGEPGVLVHGISIKPGKPTIVAMIGGKPAFGLPGNPVSAMVVFDLLVRPTLYWLSGCKRPPEPSTVTATLSRDVASVAGREDYVQVRLARSDGLVSAEPVFGKSNLIYTLIRADGTIKVPMDKGGLYAGEQVSVRLH